MGVLDFLKRDSNSKINRLAKRFLNEHQQQQIRQEALEELVTYESPEAISALIRRLGVNFRDTIKNEQEKRWVSEQLVNRYGQNAIEPLVGFINTDQTISAAIRVLERLVGQERLVGILLAALQQYAPKDHRTIDARMQLIDAVADLQDHRIVPAVVPYAMDHDDDIRIKVMGLLDHRVGPDHADYATVSDQLFEVLTDSEASGRITRRAAQALHTLKVDLSGRAEIVAEFVPDGFSFDGTHLIPH
ncbi:MAG: hypothetical protein R3F60_20055 [bacterium]